MSTFADLKTLVAQDIIRPDLTSQISAAVLSAVQDHSVERFWFNETRTFSVSLTTGSSGEYSITPTSTIQEFIKIDWLRVQIGSQWVRMDRIDADNMEEFQLATTTGQPQWWTYYADRLRVYPEPDRTYSSRIAGHIRLVALSADTDTNAWTNAAKDLIRYSALKRVLAFPVRNAEAALGAATMEAQQLDALRRETDRRKRTGTMAAYHG